MESYYSEKDVLPLFSGYTRPGGNGFRSIAAGVGRVALPFAKKFLFPAMKNNGKELFNQSVPELLEVVTEMKTPNQGAKSATRKTTKEQVGGRARKKVNKWKKKPARSRSDLFSELKSAD